MIDAFDQTVPMTEQSTYDFNIAPTLDDSDPLALANSDDDWLIQFVELNHQVPSALESVDNSFGLCLSGPPLQSQGDQSQQQAIQWDGNFLNDHSIQHTSELPIRSFVFIKLLSSRSKLIQFYPLPFRRLSG